MIDPHLFAVPAFLSLIALESFVAARRGLAVYEARDTAASLAMGVGSVVINGATTAVKLALYIAVYEYRLFDLGTGALALALALLGDELAYYLYHRAGHEVRVVWAAHVNHHSSEHYNLGTALRQSWTATFVGFPFWLWLPLLGVHPALLATAGSLRLIYQFWIHTELIGRLGPLEWVFNTPSHHRVHHGTNPQYLDRNYGGTLILFDRLFGSFEPEAEPVRYGLTHNIETFNPLRIAFHEWAAMLRDMRGAVSLSEALGYVFGRPGWRPGDTSHTAPALRESLRSSASGA